MAQAPQSRTLPPLEWLRVFESAARLGNFTLAAGELGLTQAAVSQRIRNLESHLGKPLFTRLPRGVELTIDGEAYQPIVRVALAALARGTADLFSAKRRKLSLIASASVITHWITPRLPQLMTSHPDLEISLITAHRAADFENTPADFDVRFGNGIWPGRGTKKLFSETLAPVLSPALLKRAPENWRMLPTIALSGPRHGWLDWAQAAMVEPPRSPLMRFDTFSLALNAAIMGQGVLLGSLNLIKPELDSGKLVRLPEPSTQMETGYWLTWEAGSETGKDHCAIMNCFCR